MRRFWMLSRPLIVTTAGVALIAVDLNGAVGLATAFGGGLLVGWGLVLAWDVQS